MAHITYTRNVWNTRGRSLSEVLPEGNLRASFAAFCGTSPQRLAVGMRGIQRCCGHMGVVVLQNDPLLARAVGQIRRSLPDVARQHPQFRTYSVNPAGSFDRFYDPLYGLTRTAVLDAIAPMNGVGYGANPVIDLRNYLSAYLEIMEVKHQQNPRLFGRYPYNLDLLRDLTGMSYVDLERQVLNYLPEAIRKSLSGPLSQNGVQQQVNAVVNAFVMEMQDFLWSPRDFSAHTRVSIVEAVRERCVISVTIPSPRPAVLRYLFQELKVLKDARDEFLLLVSGVNLSESPELRSLFTDAHENASYYTGVLASDVSHVFGSDNNIAPFLAEHQEVLVFSCVSAQQAAPFSEALGTYQRIVTDSHEDRRRPAFHIFADHGRGVHRREVTEHNVNAQELMSLDQGAVLCGSLYNPPIVIDRVML